MGLGDKHSVGLPRTEAYFAHPNTGQYIALPDGTYRGTDNNHGRCLDSPNDGTNCYNAGDGYNGGHPCTRGCGCIKLTCDGSGNLLTEGGGVPSAIGTADNFKRDVYVPRKLKVYLQRDDYGMRRSAEANSIEPWPAKHLMGSYIHNELFDLEWSSGAWRGSISCAPKLKFSNNEFYIDGEWVSEGGICSNTKYVTRQSCTEKGAVWSSDPFSYSGRFETSNGGNTPIGIARGRVNEPYRVFQAFSVDQGSFCSKPRHKTEEDCLARDGKWTSGIITGENSWAKRGFCWTALDGVDENGDILSEQYTEILTAIGREDCTEGGCYKEACVVDEVTTDHTKSMCPGIWAKVINLGLTQAECLSGCVEGAIWVDNMEWYQDSCIKDGSKPPRLTGKCLLERTNDESGTGSVSAPVIDIGYEGEVSAQPLVITEDNEGAAITNKQACELAGATLTTAKITEFGADNPGKPPYQLRWDEGEYDQSQCCGGHVITKKSPWFIPNTKSGSTARKSMNPNPERGEVGVCYTPRKELIVFPYNIGAAHACTNFENQSDRTNAKDGFYDYFGAQGTNEAGAYTAIYRGCDFYNACPQTEDEDDRGDDPLAAGRTLTLFIPQNQMLSIGNLNLTSSSKRAGSHHFVSSYAGWDYKMARLGNPAPWSAYMPSWDGGPTVWTDEIADHDGSTEMSDKHIGIGDGKIKTYCGYGIATSDCRNPSGNSRLNYFNLKPQPFKATEIASSNKKTLFQALEDQKAHARCLGMGCVPDLCHGLDYWFEHDFNYVMFGTGTPGKPHFNQNCWNKRLALWTTAYNAEGGFKCGSCDSGPWAYMGWLDEKPAPNRNSCQYITTEKDCTGTGWCKGSVTGPCGYVDGESFDADDDVFDGERKWESCDQEACEKDGGVWQTTCYFTPHPTERSGGGETDDGDGDDASQDTDDGTMEGGTGSTGSTGGTGDTGSTDEDPGGNGPQKDEGVCKPNPQSVTVCNTSCGFPKEISDIMWDEAFVDGRGQCMHKSIGTCSDGVSKNMSACNTNGGTWKGNLLLTNDPSDCAAVGGKWTAGNHVYDRDSLSYWDKTGLMPFNTMPASYVSDTCYGGTLFGAVEKATNTGPIIITSSDHKLRPGDEIEVTDVIGNFKANSLTGQQWAEVNYEDKKTSRRPVGGGTKYIWPHAKMTDCVTPPKGGWGSKQTAAAEKYGYFTVCGVMSDYGTGADEAYLPTKDTFALCDCNGDIVEGFIDKGTNIPSCPTQIDNTMYTCVNPEWGEEIPYAAGEVDFNPSTNKYELGTIEPHVNISCQGDTQEERSAEGRNEECEQTCKEWGRCKIIERWVQKYDNNGDKIRTGSGHAECADCLEGTAETDYSAEEFMMTQADCLNLAKTYKKLYIGTPDEAHYPSNVAADTNNPPEDPWEQLEWTKPDPEPDEENFTPPSWKHCPFTGKWNLNSSREDSDLKINVPYKNPGPEKYAPGTAIPVSTTKFLGGYSIPGDLTSMSIERSDLANHWYIGIEQDGHCGGCQDHYLKTFTNPDGDIGLMASITEGVTSDLQKEMCGYRCDGSLWWDGYCCNCPDNFEGELARAIEDACGKDAVRPTSNLHLPTTGPRALEKDRVCAYETETALRKKMCGLCGCTYRMRDNIEGKVIEDPISGTLQTDPCCSCDCISPNGDTQVNPGTCSHEDPACATLKYPTIESFDCCRPPYMACDPEVGGVGVGGVVTLGNMSCTCRVIDDLGGGYKLWGYGNCSPCVGFPKGRAPECQPNPMCADDPRAEDYCHGVDTGTGNSICIPNPASSDCTEPKEGMRIPIHCTTTGDCHMRSGCKGLGGLDIPLLWNGSSWESDWTLMNTVGKHQCASYTKVAKCRRARCIMPNGSVRLGPLEKQSFKDDCLDGHGLYQEELASQPVPGADCGSCRDPFDKYYHSNSPKQDRPPVADEYIGQEMGGEGPNFTTDPAVGGHFMRLSFGCDVNYDNAGATSTVGSRIIGAGFQSFESHLIDTMNLEMEITTCSVRHCQETELGVENDSEGLPEIWAGTSRAPSDDVFTTPQSIGGIGCVYFNPQEHKCFEGCVATEWNGPGYPCTGCCDIDPGGGYKGFAVCSGPLIAFCNGTGNPIMSNGATPDKEKGQEYRGPRNPEFFTVHSVDIDHNGYRGYDILHVESRVIGQSCAWVPKDPSDDSDDDWEIRVGIGMADKQDAESGTQNDVLTRDSYSRNMLSMTQDWPTTTKLVNVIPGRVNRSKKYFEIHVESASVLMTKASSLNRELEIRESKTQSIQSIIEETRISDGGGEYSRKGGTSPIKQYGDLPLSHADKEKFIGLDMYYNKSLPYPYGRNPWPVGVQSTPITPWETVYQNELDKKLESFRRSITTGVRGRVGKRPTSSYLNYLNDRFYDFDYTDGSTGSGGDPGSPDYHPYEDIEIERVEDVYTTAYECDKEGNPTFEQCVADKSITPQDPTGNGGKWNVVYEKFLHTVVHTYKPHDLQTGEKVVISDSICHTATCKNVASGMCVERFNLSEYQRDPTNNPLKPDWDKTEMTCSTNGDNWFWHEEFRDEDITQKECEEKKGTNPDNTSCNVINPVTQEPYDNQVSCELAGGTWDNHTRGEWMMGQRQTNSDVHNENPEDIQISDFLTGCTPHCAIESMVVFPEGQDDFGGYAGGACHPNNCDALHGTCPAYEVGGGTVIRNCPRCGFDGSHIVKFISPTSFALYSESYIHYEDFESSLRVNDAKKTPKDYIEPKKAGGGTGTSFYIDWLDNYDPSMNFLCEDVYTKLDGVCGDEGGEDKSQEDCEEWDHVSGDIQAALCRADNRCDVGAKTPSSLICVSRGICSTINDLYDGTPGHADRKRKICGASDHCVDKVVYNTDGGINKVECLGTENPNTMNSTKNEYGLNAHFPGYEYGAEVGLGKAKEGLTRGGIYIGQNDIAMKKFKDHRNIGNLKQRGKWSRSGGLFDIGVGMIRPHTNFNQDFAKDIDSGMSKYPVSQDYRFTLPDRCCNHKYPTLLANCVGYGTCSPGRTQTIGEEGGPDGLFDKANEASAAIINVTITEHLA